MVHDGACAGGFAPGADLVSVAIDEVDVLLDPFENEALVVKTCVGQGVALHGRS